MLWLSFVSWSIFCNLADQMRTLVTYHHFMYGSPRTEIPSDIIVSQVYFKLLILNTDMKL